MSSGGEKGESSSEGPNRAKGEDRNYTNEYEYEYEYELLLEKRQPQPAVTLLI